jgi:low affinity Fe/Cu permease
MAGKNNNQAREKSWAVRMGDRMSDATSKLFAHPYMQIGVILFCISWFVLGFHADLLTAALSILAITLTQMVLNSQYDREAEAHRRDVAMHAKLDELVFAVGGARNEMAGIEELDEAEIHELKEEVIDTIDQAGNAAGGPRQRAAAKKTIAKATAKVANRSKSADRNRAKPRTGGASTPKPPKPPTGRSSRKPRARTTAKA